MKYILIFFAFLFIASTSTMWVPIVTDHTLTGIGNTDDPLKVDTSVIATPFDLIAATRGSEISPAQITADQDDYNPTGWDDATTVRLDGDNGIRAITSMAAPTTSLKPQEKILMNIGSFPVYFPGEHPDGTAANRIDAPQDIILYPKQSVRIIYDQTSLRWRVMGEYEAGSNRVFYEQSGSNWLAGDYGDLVGLAINSGQIAQAQATSTIPASFTISTQTTTNGGGHFGFCKGNVMYSAYGSAHQYAEAYITTPSALSDVTNTYTIELQLTASMTSTSLENNNDIGIRYSHDINSGKWELFTQDNAGAEGTPTDLGVTVAAATSYKLRLESNKSNTEVRAYINGVYVGRKTANMPNAVINGMRLILLKSAGNTARLVNIHQLSAGAIYP